MCFGSEVQETYEKLKLILESCVDIRTKEAVQISINKLVLLGAKEKK